MTSSIDLHVFFLPFLTPGHTIPLVDTALLFAARGAKCTVVTTTANALFIRPTIDRSPHPIHVLTLPFSHSSQNVTDLPTPEITSDFAAALDSLETPFRLLVNEHRPDCIVSDVFYPWTAALAADFGIRRLAFHVTSAFAIAAGNAVGQLRLHSGVAGNDEPFVLLGLPHRIEMTRSQLPSSMTAPSDIMKRIGATYATNDGMLMNSFYELESQYASQLNYMRTWYVGPVSLANTLVRDEAVRGGSDDNCLAWLDSKEPGSVLYVCFGTLPRFTAAQLRNMAAGLEASGCPFVWVVREGEEVPEGFEERVVGGGKGLVVRGWAPQALILNHRAVGGSVTQCGWNSCLEAVAAGVPVITWPLFSEQFFNEKLMVDVLGIGVAVGAKVCTYLAEERTVVTAEEVRVAVEGLMGGGEAAEERRRRARELAEKARRAVEAGGSSYEDLGRLIEELAEVKNRKAD